MGRGSEIFFESKHFGRIKKVAKNNMQESYPQKANTC